MSATDSHKKVDFMRYMLESKLKSVKLKIQIADSFLNVFRPKAC